MPDINEIVHGGFPTRWNIPHSQGVYRKRMKDFETSKDASGDRRVLAIAVALMGLVLASQPAAAGDRIAEGKRLTMERSEGNCLACHAIEDGKLPGNVGPPLVAMKQRFPDRDVLREQVCDATVRNPYTRMPPFCRHGILTSEEVDLIVDYLYTL
jgi:sulfur-oxidizing protein SoxX